MRAIDADEVFKAVYDMACQSVLIPGCEDYAHGLREAANYIENAPTLDVVPVIRCRECKHKSQGISDKMRTWCSMWQCWILAVVMSYERFQRMFEKGIDINEY